MIFTNNANGKVFLANDKISKMFSYRHIFKAINLSVCRILAIFAMLLPLADNILWLITTFWDKTARKPRPAT